MNIDESINNINGNHQKIIVYDYSNKFTKINQNILVIGVAYEKNDMIIIHCWKIIENYEKMKICKDSYSLINITENKNIYREKLKNILSKSVKNDKLATEYKEKRKDVVISRLEGQANSFTLQRYSIFRFPVIALFKPKSKDMYTIFQIHLYQ